MKPAAHSPRPTSGGRHILIVEDDARIRETEAQLLRAAGYLVATAGDGEAGWTLLCTGSYDLLVTDHQMPRLSGMQLIWRLHAAGLRVPVIMTSGFALVEVVNPAPEPVPWFKAFLQKPFGPRELLETVRHVLGEGEPLPAQRQAELNPYPAVTIPS